MGPAPTMHLSGSCHEDDIITGVWGALLSGVQLIGLRILGEGASCFRAGKSVDTTLPDMLGAVTLVCFSILVAAL